MKTLSLMSMLSMFAKKGRKFVMYFAIFDAAYVRKSSYVEL